MAYIDMYRYVQICCKKHWHTLDPTHFVKAAEDLDIHMVGLLEPRHVEGDAPAVEPHASWLGMACLCMSAEHTET